jgi:hypothetical protein
VAHPLAPGLARLRELSGFLDAGLGRPPGGWTSLARLSADRSMLDDVLKRNALAYGGTRRIAANFVVGGVAWAAAGVPLALMTVARHAIAPEPDATFLHVDARGEARGAFFDDPSFCTLAGDPAGRHGRATTAEDVTALHEWMRARVVGSLTPFVAALSDLTSLSRRGLWGQVASSCGSVIVWAARLSGRGTAGIEEAQAFLTGPGWPFFDPPSFYRLHIGGEELVAMRRGVCCLSYKLADSPYCSSCPFISEGERETRQREEWRAGRG